MTRSQLLYEKVDYCPLVHGGCGEPLEWPPPTGGVPAGKDADTDTPESLETTCGSCGHHWRLAPGVGMR
jgi:hypothetical protein